MIDGIDEFEVSDVAVRGLTSITENGALGVRAEVIFHMSGGGASDACIKVDFDMVGVNAHPFTHVEQLALVGARALLHAACRPRRERIRAICDAARPDSRGKTN